MTDSQDRSTAGSAKAKADFFTVGPPLHAVRSGYVRRSADQILFDSITAGHDAYVLAPERSGKSSLIAATSARLQNNGYKVATLDLAQIGDRDGGSDAGRWYYNIAYRLLRQLRIKFDLHLWWQDKSMLSNRQRLVEFYIEVILANTTEQVVVFIDEVQCIESLAFGQDLLASIRAVHNSLTTEPQFSRLVFALCGECDPQILVTKEGYSPFESMRQVPLADFSRQDIDVFSAELYLTPADAETALDRIYFWTNGQPYLSQKLARAVAREQISGDISDNVDRLAEHQLGGRSALHNEPHMGHIHRRVVGEKSDREAILNMYGRMRKGIEVQFDPESRPQRKLIAVGLTVVDQDGNLKCRNRLYESVFTARWANENLPIRWRGPASAAALFIILVAVPFWYTQLLAKPYVRILMSPTLPVTTVADAYANLRSFPGHADTADRLFAIQLQARARAAVDLDEITRIGVYAGNIPGRDRFGEELTAIFWDLNVSKALRQEQRDEALIASLEALVASTPARRRVAASLLGDDYSQLIQTVALEGSERLMFNAENQLLTMVIGARMSQWNVINQQLQSRDSWTVSALEVTPLVRRVAVDRPGFVSRISLSVNVGHSRLDDLRMRLIAPSGRAIEIAFEQSASTETEEIRFGGSELSSLVGETLTGTWTLSLRDEATGTAGHLIGWNLRLNSQVIVENFERGLDIPEPTERESNNIWFSRDGRYAIARAQQSNSARLWDLAYAQPARTIAVPASQNVLGLSANAEYLVTIAQDTVHIWSTANGRRMNELDIGFAVDAQLTVDGQSLLVSRYVEGETAFDLWNLEKATRVSSLTIAGIPALATVDRTGEYLAIADYDRAVRIWHLPSGELRGQLDLHASASHMELSPGGEALGVVHGNQGVSLWRTNQSDGPILKESAVDSWQIVFSPSGALFMAGGGEQGFQLYRTADGAVSGPKLGSGLGADANKLLSFSNDERTIVTADASGFARFWNAPTLPVVSETSGDHGVGSLHRLWRESADSIAAISPGGRRLAVGDKDGHVHILNVGTRHDPLTEEADELSFLGHRGEVVNLAFSADGLLIASAGIDGTVRIWDVASGLPRPFYASASSSTIGRLHFSASGNRLAVLSGQSAWIMNVETGSVLADVELGELHTDIAFVDDDRVYLAGESGTLRSLSADRLGQWNLRNVWQGQSPLRRIALSPTRRFLVMVDTENVARVFNANDGGIGSMQLDLPSQTTDILFNRGESRVLLRSSRWIHRADVSRSGLVWLNAMRAPQALHRSNMVFDAHVDASSADASESSRLDAAQGNRILLLTRDAGFVELAGLHFEYADGPLLIGARDELLADWSGKIGGKYKQQ